jgi:hypothetical protein
VRHTCTTCSAPCCTAEHTVPHTCMNSVAAVLRCRARVCVCVLCVQCHQPPWVPGQPWRAPMAAIHALMAAIHALMAAIHALMAAIHALLLRNAGEHVLLHSRGSAALRKLRCLRACLCSPLCCMHALIRFTAFLAMHACLDSRCCVPERAVMTRRLTSVGGASASGMQMPRQCR